MTSIHDLHDIANLLGVKLRHHNGLPKGWYSPSLRVISTMRDMAVWDYKTTLAHELGHAVYNDQKTGNRDFDRRQEARADRFAAKLLINDDELKHLAPWHGHDFHSLAIDLEVTPHILEIYLKERPHILKELAT
ncbi:ImmA/IrrE family metallo-endopeptidase [Corynebacterium macclintockiae]|uniref:ImmA/IrrE family metallo-endopeptidase n=1 Tax=Corynebacterium macclintockiae TaxID=2913501 RepID=UPI003EB75540